MKYSVAEIAEMRGYVRSIVEDEGVGAPYRVADRAVEVEARLQTYMLNGTSVTQLAEAASRARDELLSDDL